MSDIYIAEARRTDSGQLPVCYEISGSMDPTVLTELDVLSSAREVLDSTPILPNERFLMDQSYESGEEDYHWLTQGGLIADLGDDGHLVPHTYSPDHLDSYAVPTDVAKMLGNYAAHEFAFAVKLSHSEDGRPYLESAHQHLQALIEAEGQLKPVVTILDDDYLAESHGSKEVARDELLSRHFQSNISDLITLQPLDYSA